MQRGPGAQKVAYVPAAARLKPPAAPEQDPQALIPGLRIVRDFITKERVSSVSSSVAKLPIQEEEEEMLRAIEDANWDADLKRKTQQYGWRFEHSSQKIRAFLGPLPQWCANVTNRLVERGLYAYQPDQMIINHYSPGQGINPHVDKVHCFDDTVGSVGLGSSCIMEFRNNATLAKVDVFFERRMAVVLTGESRYQWTHGIPAQTEDTWRGAVYRRKNRISLTWRRVTLDAKDREKFVAAAQSRGSLPPIEAPSSPPTGSTPTDDGY